MCLLPLVAERREECRTRLYADGVDEDDKPQRRDDFRQRDVGTERTHGDADKQHTRQAETKTEDADLPEKIAEPDDDEERQDRHRRQCVDDGAHEASIVNARERSFELQVSNADSSTPCARNRTPVRMTALSDDFL